jgi:hypothetical protein
VLKFLRPLAVLLFVATAVYAVPRNPEAPPPICYDLPTCQNPDSSYTYSHECLQNGYVAYVWVDPLGNWCLYGPILP